MGLATAAVEAMVAEAFADPEVREVTAHTFPERNASNRVLEKVGFRFSSETPGRDGRLALLAHKHGLIKPTGSPRSLGAPNEGESPLSARWIP